MIQSRLNSPDSSLHLNGDGEDAKDRWMLGMGDKKVSRWVLHVPPPIQHQEVDGSQSVAST